MIVCVHLIVIFVFVTGSIHAQKTDPVLFGYSVKGLNDKACELTITAKMGEGCLLQVVLHGKSRNMKTKELNARACNTSAMPESIRRQYLRE